MTSSIIFRYQFGERRSIEAAAADRGTFWTGLVLVLTAAIARNYDQTFLGEAPIRWLFGNLGFSIISGSLLYLLAYALPVNRSEATRSQAASGQWSQFMGLFWLTAPTAWLYAIPIERFVGSLHAAEFNVGLLTLVAVWRVVLMARVLQVVTGMARSHALLFVVLPACIETFAISLFSDAFGKGLMASMAGLRNSPAEEVIINTFRNAFNLAVILGGLTSVCVLIITAAGSCSCTRRLNEPVAGSIPKRFLRAVLGLWVAASLLPQRELHRNYRVERALARGDARGAIELMAGLQPSDFAPSRPLPPKAYERSTFEELPAFLAALRPGDPQWVVDHLLQRLEELVDSTVPEYQRRQPDPPELGDRFWQWFPEDDQGTLEAALRNLATLPQCREWRLQRRRLIETLAETASGRWGNGHQEAGATWEGRLQQLSNLVHSARSDTNQPAPRKP